MEQINQQVGLALKQLRQQRGWSLDQAAQACGVSKAMLGQIERGESSPTVVTLWKIAGGFHVPFSYFMAVPSSSVWTTCSSQILSYSVRAMESVPAIVGILCRGCGFGAGGTARVLSRSAAGTIPGPGRGDPGYHSVAVRASAGLRVIAGGAAGGLRISLGTP